MYEFQDDDVERLRDTAHLIHFTQKDNLDARSLLFDRYYPRLEKFLHARLSSNARKLKETGDLVHEVFMKAIKALKTFEYRGIGSFWAYLCKIGIHHIYETERKFKPEIRIISLSKESRSNANAAVKDPLDALAAKELLAAYDMALETLTQKERWAIRLRNDLDMSYKMIAEDVGYPSADAARKAIVRALEKVYREIAGGRIRK